jgi:hypothetical protein
MIPHVGLTIISIGRFLRFGAALRLSDRESQRCCERQDLAGRYSLVSVQ